MEYANVIEYDPSTGIGRVLTVENESFPFQQIGDWKIGDLVSFRFGRRAVNLCKSAAPSSIGVIQAPNDAANSAKPFNPAYHGQHGNREAIAAQTEQSDELVVGCTTSSDSGDDLKSPTFRPWND